jgi:nitrogen-specific signal transduction histidine kinase
MSSRRKKHKPRLIGEIMNIVHNAVLLVDAKNMIFFANSMTAKMFNTGVNELSGLDFKEIFMPEDRDVMFGNIVEQTQRLGEFDSEIMLRRLDGSTFLGLISCAYFVWEGESCMAVTVHNVSKMKALERMLEKTERVAFLGHMLDDINHQIRNPVLVIGGLANRLIGQVSGNKYAETILKESQRLEKLLERLNDFIMLPPPRQKRINLEEIIRELESRFRPLVEMHGVSWDYHYAEELLADTALVDFALLLEAVEAVVLNSCEAYGRGAKEKKISINVFDTGDESWPYAIQVIDFGLGISGEDLPYVVSPFFSKKTKHLGMGLTFARRIIEEQKGKLAVESSEADGTVVTFSLIKERRRLVRTRRLAS